MTAMNAAFGEWEITMGKDPGIPGRYLIFRDGRLAGSGRIAAGSANEVKKIALLILRKEIQDATKGQLDIVARDAIIEIDGIVEEIADVSDS